MRSFRRGFTCLLLLLVSNAGAMELDDQLSLVLKVYQLEAKVCPKNDQQQKTAQIRAGEMLFNSVVISGNRDIACAHCHLDEFGSADGLAISVGVGGKGKGFDRIYGETGVLVQRNALSLVGRANHAFTAYFWDGKVQQANQQIYSQFGDKINKKLSSPLAVAAIMPLVERDEFLGESGLFAANDFQWAVKDAYYYARYQSLSDALRKRLLKPETRNEEELTQALSEAEVTLSDLTLADVGNLLAEFIAFRFPCEENAWDRYIKGEYSALTRKQKEGALLFYGKGRCASCHTGFFFSDFKYHSIGTPQGAFGPHSRHRDLGRAGVTQRRTDLYLFRTPPLTGVSKTSPYGHNGIFKTLREVVVHHFNPIAFYAANPDIQSLDYFVVGKLTGSRAEVLISIDLQTEEELLQLEEFLHVL